jgi:hypothetical protein
MHCLLDVRDLLFVSDEWGPGAAGVRTGGQDYSDPGARLSWLELF